MYLGQLHRPRSSRAALSLKFLKTKPLNLVRKGTSVLMLLLTLLLWSWLLKNTKVETGLKSREQLVLEAGELDLDCAWWNLSQSCCFLVLLTHYLWWGSWWLWRAGGRLLRGYRKTILACLGALIKSEKTSWEQYFLSKNSILSKMGNWCMQWLWKLGIQAPVRCPSRTRGKERGEVVLWWLCRRRFLEL